MDSLNIFSGSLTLLTIIASRASSKIQHQSIKVKVKVLRDARVSNLFGLHSPTKSGNSLFTTASKVCSAISGRESHSKAAEAWLPLHWPSLLRNTPSPTIQSELESLDEVV